MRHVPWHVKGVHPEAREVARDAARRSGLSVGEWLNSLIIDANADADTHPVGAGQTARDEPYVHFQPTGDVRFAAIGKRIDELKSQIDLLSQGNHGRTAARFPHDDGTPNAYLADTIARIDRQLEGLRRNAQPDAFHQVDYGVDAAVAEITARQQALDAEFAEPQPSGGSGAGRELPLPQRDPTIIEQQLRDIAEQIKGLQGSCRVDGMAAALSRTVENAAPKQAIEAIEKQLRRLTSQLETVPSPLPVDQIVESLRHGLADIGRRLDHALPQRAGSPIEDRILGLTEQVAKLAAPPRADEIAEILRPDLTEIRAALNSAMPRRDAAGIEEQIRALAQEVAKLHPPLRAEDVVDAVRRDLGELGAALKNAMPQHAMASIEQQVQALNARIAQLHSPPRVEEIADALRQDLAQVGAALRNAMPTSALAALEQEVRALGARIDANRAAQPESPVLADLEQSLAEIRDRLRAMMPAEDLAALNDAIKALSHKADAIASERAAPDMLGQLEQAIGALHGVASQVASQDAVAGLSRDIRDLGDKIDRGARQAGDPDIMSMLDKRLAEMTDALGRSRPTASPAIPADFDTIIKKLADRLESIQIPAADPLALTNLEQRIVGLVDKVGASEARLGRLDGVERGMDELLAQLKELRTQNESKLQAIQHQLVASTTEAISAPAEAIRRDVATLKEIHSSADRRTQDTFEAVYGTIEQVVDRLATIERNLRDGDPRKAPPAWREPAGGSAVAPTFAAAPAMAPNAPPLEAPAAAAPMPDRATAASAAELAAASQLRFDASPKAASSQSPAKPAVPERHAIISDLPPDAPLEPGSVGRRVRTVANAIDRIAASEAANAAGSGAAKPAAAAPARANFVAAARRAAQAVASAQADSPAARTERAAPDAKGQSRIATLKQKFGPRVKSLIFGISVTMLVLGTLRLALDLFYNPAPPPSAQPSRLDDAVPPASPADPTILPEPQSPPVDAPRTGKGAALVPPPSAIRNSTVVFPGETTLGQSPTSGVLNDFAFPAMAPRSIAAQPRAPIPTPVTATPDTTGSVPGRTALPQMPQSRDATPQPPQATAARDVAREPAQDALPPAIGGKTLIAAATAGEPGASYEIAARYAEGRNVPQDLAMAAAWFDRAARGGLVPAQFRLGSMYEKGLGLKKDLQEARRLYLGAADRGHAKAMHNLAVLYAEGLDGTPDYAAAAQWFRKAAAYGVVDSQYNLAILYARGVGVERNMAESYKWFALAAKGGDKDAGKKRDDIASRLDPLQLEGARQAVEAFVPEHQPEEASATKAPSGGWDQVAATAPAKPKAVR
jgi:localization factor PodJL